MKKILLLCYMVSLHAMDKPFTDEELKQIGHDKNALVTRCEQERVRLKAQWGDELFKKVYDAVCIFKDNRHVLAPEMLLIAEAAHQPIPYYVDENLNITINPGKIFVVKDTQRQIAQFNVAAYLALTMPDGGTVFNTESKKESKTS